MSKQESRSVKLRRKTKYYGLTKSIYKIVCFLLIIGAAFFASTIFFKIKVITVEGLTRYDEQDVILALGAEYDENLFFWGMSDGIEKVKDEFPYIAEVKVSCTMPDTLKVEIVEGSAYAVLDNQDNMGYLIDYNGKILEKVWNLTYNYLPYIIGVVPAQRQEGQMLNAQNSESERALIEILPYIQQYLDASEVNTINLADPFQIHIGYRDILDVRLGTTTDIERKLQFLNEIVEQKLSPSDIGVIELSSTQKMHFWPESIENVKEYTGME